MRMTSLQFGEREKAVELEVQFTPSARTTAPEDCTMAWVRGTHTRTPESTAVFTSCDWLAYERRPLGTGKSTSTVVREEVVLPTASARFITVAAVGATNPRGWIFSFRMLPR